MRLGCPIDAHEPVAFILHSEVPRCHGAAAMFAVPCTGARRRGLPTGHPPRPPVGAQVPPGVRNTGGAWSLPTGRLSSRGYRDRKDAARLEALCFATLRVVLQAARNPPRTAEEGTRGVARRNNNEALGVLGPFSCVWACQPTTVLAMSHRRIFRTILLLCGSSRTLGSARQRRPRCSSPIRHELKSCPQSKRCLHSLESAG